MKLVVKNSPLSGKGVFASEDIAEGEIIESCNLIVLIEGDTLLIDNTALYDYYFAWKDKGCAIALGFGSLYNHSYEPNAVYKKDFEKETLTFVSLKPIRKGEEITVNYNGDPRNKEKVWFDK